MPKFFTILFFALIVQISAQTSSPKLINYQGVARDAAGIPITSNFDIQFIIKDASSVIHNEIQTGISPNALGLFSTLIGKPPNTFTPTILNNGPFSLDVLIKTGSTFTLVGSQPIVSVPFALHANNVPSSYTNNILTIGANSYSLNSGSTITPTLSGDVVGSISTTTVTALRNFPISSITPTNNQMLSFVSGSWTPISPTIAAVSPWVKTGAEVTLSNITDNVGIGIALPNTKLDVAGLATTTTSILKVTNSNTGNSSPAIIVSSNGGAAINASDNTTAGANAGEFNSQNGAAIFGLTNSNSKPSIIGENASLTPNSLASGIFGKTSNPDGNAAGVYGENLGGGHGIKGITYGPVSAVRAINLHTTTLAPFADGIYASTSNNSSSAAGVYGINLGGGPGVFGSNSNGTFAGILGSGSGSSPAIQGTNSGSGPAMYGLKTGTASTGNAGRFEINNQSNAADALFASTLGSGAAVHAVTSATLNSSALALLLENGHISATGTLPSTAIVNSLNGGNLSLLGTSTDVAGRITITFGTGPFPAGGYAQILYSKPYAVAPIIILTAANGAASSNQVFVTSNLTNFIINYNSSPLTGPHVFNYIIIETK